MATALAVSPSIRFRVFRKAEINRKLGYHMIAYSEMPSRIRHARGICPCSPGWALPAAPSRAGPSLRASSPVSNTSTDKERRGCEVLMLWLESDGGFSKTITTVSLWSWSGLWMKYL